MKWIHALLIVSLAMGVTACGYKGRLHSPSQIEAAEAKKARKEAKEEKAATKPSPAATSDDSSPPPPPQPYRTPLAPQDPGAAHPANND